MATWTITEPRNLDIEGEVRRLDVWLIGGRLSVVGTDGPARVEVSRIGETPVNVSHEGGALAVRHPKPSVWPGVLQPLWWWLHGVRRFDTDVSIAVPSGTTCVLRSASGSVVASGLASDLQVECVSGRIVLLGDSGQVRASIVSGPIEALGCGGSVTLETVSGEITLADSATRRVHAKTVSGAVTADLDNPPQDSDIHLETISGEITIRVREDSDLAVRLSAASGRVTSAFPALIGKLPARHSRSLNGALGAGTGRLQANAVSGNISLLSRPVDDGFGEDAAE
jgi:DUF4097 and DUF4098 domain-containing protein YvlB